VEPEQARIEIAAPDEEERALALGDRLTIGRSSKSDLVIDHLDCSRAHAELRRRTDGGYEVVDLGSRNGCFVNGRRVEGSRTLVDGDRIEIAEVVLRFLRGEPGAPAHEAVRAGDSSASLAPAPALAVSAELPAVVLAAEVVGYARLARSLAPAPLHEIVSDWIADAQRVIERARGTFDRMANQSVIGYWLVDDPAQPQPEIMLALGALRALMGVCEDVAPHFARRFDGLVFATSAGLHVGTVRLGNAGATQSQVWTVTGDAVLAAVALLALSEERSHPALVSDAVARHSPATYRFEPVGRSDLSEAGRPIEALAFADVG